MVGDLGHQALVIVHVKIVARGHADQTGADLARFENAHGGLHAHALGLVARGDGAGAVGALDRHHGDRAAAQLGAHLLLDAREVSVEVEHQIAGQAFGTHGTPN